MINKDSINTVQALIEENGRITVADIERYFKNVACNLPSHKVCLGTRKICARWIPKLLDDKYKWNQVAAGLDFVSRNHAKVP